MFGNLIVEQVLGAGRWSALIVLQVFCKKKSPRGSGREGRGTGVGDTQCIYIMATHPKPIKAEERWNLRRARPWTAVP